MAVVAAGKNAGASGTLAPLRHGVFRRIWTASLLSNLGLLIMGVGAAWAMTQMTSSADKVALVQTALMLPVALLSTVAGAVAAKMVLDQIVKSGTVTHGWIGVEVQEITPPIAESFKLGDTRGALIAGVLRGGPAEKAGVKPGDVLTEVEGKPVADPTTMLNLVAALAPGKPANVKLKRNGSAVDATITVGRRPKPQARASE